MKLRKIIKRDIDTENFKVLITREQLNGYNFVYIISNDTSLTDPVEDMLCKVCNDSEAKYKCSTCYFPYCSLACWKNHKSQNECKPVEKVANDCTTKPTNVDRKYFTEDTISPENLSKLGDSKVLKEILKNKYLQHTLLAVENATNPEKAVFNAMKDPDFVNFVDECLKIVEDPND